MNRKSATLGSPPRSLREAIAQSQLETSEIIARVGCSRRSLTQWKAGQRPSDYNIGRLSKELGVDLWPLYGNSDKREFHARSDEANWETWPSDLGHPVQSSGLTPLDVSFERRGHIDESMRSYWSNQLEGLWTCFHFSTDTDSVHLQRMAASTHLNMLQTFTAWPMNQEEKKWLLIQVCEGNILAGRIARDQLNFEEATQRHKIALSLALQTDSANHVVGACMRLAETLLDGGSVLEAEQYATAGINQGRGHANARVFGELLGLASNIYATLGDHASSEKVVNEAANLSVGSTSQATAGGIRFGETAASTYQMVEALRRGDARAALLYIEAAMKRMRMDFPQGGNTRWEAHLLIHQARAYASVGELDGACGSLRRAAQLASQVNSRIGMRKVQDALTDVRASRRGPAPMLQSLQEELRHTLSSVGTSS